MKDRLDHQIQERAPWVFRPGYGWLRKILMRVLSYDRSVRLAESFENSPADEIMDRMGRLIARDVTAQGIEHIPEIGPALIVANHPTGIADAIVLHRIIRRLRGDIYFFANADIQRVLPQMEEMIVPVEWRLDKRSLRKSRETMVQTRGAIEFGKLGVIFPSGRLAKRRGLSLHERPWMRSAAMIAVKMDVPIIPVNMRARNSLLYYVFDIIHPTLRDITLFHETLNKLQQPFEITVGAPIDPKSLPLNMDDAIEMLRVTTLNLDSKRGPKIGLFERGRKTRGQEKSISTGTMRSSQKRL